MRILFVANDLKKTGGIQKYNSNFLESLNYEGNNIFVVELKKRNFFGKIFFSSTGTTPEVWELNKLLSKMESVGCEYVFMEVSSHGLEEKRVSRLKFAGAIFTNLSHDHLDFHKNMNNYFLAKRKLFKILPEEAFALANVDDQYGEKILENTKARKFLYGFKKNKDFYGEIKKLDFSGLELNFNGPVCNASQSDVGGEKIESKLLGKFNAYNLLAVWSVCKLLGFDMKKVKEILQNIEPPRGRFDRFVSSNGVLVVVDYAHKPDALEKILMAIKEMKPKSGRIISVFGCGGDRDPLKRPVMGKIGANLSDIAIFTSDNSRTEDPNKIIEQMKKDLTQEDFKKVITITDRRFAIKKAVELAKKGDIILCAGKGHEDYQEINGVKTHFNDLEEFKKLLK